MKKVLPNLTTYLTMASSSSSEGDQGIPPLLPEGFDPSTPNLHDFYWGLYLASVGVEAKQVPGWTSLPVEVASGVVPCPKAYRSMVLSNQLFQIGTSKAGQFIAPLGSALGW